MERLSMRIIRLYATVSRLEAVGVGIMSIGQNYIYAEDGTPEFEMPCVQAIVARDEVETLCDHISLFGHQIHGRRTDTGKPVEVFVTDNDTVVEVIPYDRL